MLTDVTVFAPATVANVGIGFFQEYRAERIVISFVI